MFIPNKSFGQLLDMSPKTPLILEFSYIDVWFTDQNSRPLDTEDKINIALVTNWKCKIKKITRYSVQVRGRIFIKDYGFLSFAKNMAKHIGEDIGKTLSGKYTQKLLDHTIINEYTYQRYANQRVAS